jgi:eukaryotic-like serine/threonine-protein kinase
MTPPALAQVVKGCLAKDPEERFQTVHDLKLQLKWIAEASSSQLAAPAQVRARRALQKRTLVIAVIVGSILAAAALAMFLLSRGQLADAQRPMTASWLPPSDMEFAFAGSGGPALSPDGSKLAFLTGNGASGRRLWIRYVISGTVRQVEGVEQPRFPFWAPDGKYIGFFSAGKLKKVALAGGPVQVLCDAPEGRGASWSPRGVIIFTPHINDPLFKVPEAGGLPERITETKPGWSNRNPYFLPDGDHFLFIARDNNSDVASAGALYGGSLSGERPRQILERGSNVQYSEGYLLYVRETVLVAQRFDPKSLKFSGDPLPVAEKLDYWNARDFAAFTAAHGTLVFRHGAVQKTQPMWVDRAGKELGRFGEPAHIRLRNRPSTAPWSGWCVQTLTRAGEMFGSSTPAGTRRRAAHSPKRATFGTRFLQTRRRLRSRPLRERPWRDCGSS